ncbi:MAG: hypothetical protein Phog2KO_44140 [Phototrophicaceae bacterium]
MAFSISLALSSGYDEMSTQPSYPKYKDTFEKINEIRDKKGLETLRLSIPFLKNISFLEDIPF